MRSCLLRLTKVVPCIRGIGSSVGPAFTHLEPSQTPAHPDGVGNTPPNQSKLPPQPPRVSADEKRLAVMWHARDGMGPKAIGDRLRRSPSSISRLLSAPPDQNPTGRPRKLTKQQTDKLSKLVDRMVKEAMAEDEVTQRMILHRSRLLRLLMVLVPFHVLVSVFINACNLQTLKDVRILLVLLERRKCIH